MHLYADNDVNLDNFDAKNSLHLSPPTLCSYIPDRMSQLTFILLDKHQTIDNKLYAKLCSEGYRRSGNAFYRPNCLHCKQCISSRVRVAGFKPSRRYRKVLNRNATTIIKFIPATKATIEHYALYQKYISARHVDGDMYPPSLQTFEQFLVQSPAQTHFMEVREPNNKLVAVAVTDRLSDGLSSIYTFFDPDQSYNSRSLGVFCILKQIETAKNLQLDFVYLGYWIPTVKKMSYKTDYTPIELLINDQWLCFAETPDSSEILKSLQTSAVLFKK